MILFITSLGIRLTGLLLHLEPAIVLPFDFLAVGGITATLAQESMPRLWGSAAGFGCAALVATLWPQYAVLSAVVAYSLYAVFFYYAWARVARKKSD